MNVQWFRDFFNITHCNFGCVSEEKSDLIFMSSTAEWFVDVNTSRFLWCSEVVLASIFLLIFLILGLVLIRLDLSFYLWFLWPRSEFDVIVDRSSVADIICKYIVWNVVLNLDLYVSLNWKRILQLVARDFFNQTAFMVVYRKWSFLRISELEKAVSKPASEKPPVYANMPCLQRAR